MKRTLYLILILILCAGCSKQEAQTAEQGSDEESVVSGALKLTEFTLEGDGSELSEDGRNADSKWFVAYEGENIAGAIQGKLVDIAAVSNVTKVSGEAMAFDNKVKEKQTMKLKIIEREDKAPVGTLSITLNNGTKCFPDRSFETAVDILEAKRGEFQAVAHGRMKCGPKHEPVKFRAVLDQTR